MLVRIQISDISDTEIHSVYVLLQKAMFFCKVRIKINMAAYVIKTLATISLTWRVSLYDHFQQGNRVLRGISGNTHRRNVYAFYFCIVVIRISSTSPSK